MARRSFLTLMLLFNNLGFAGTNSLLKPYPETVLRNEVVRFHPAAGHHFSNEAPQKCANAALIERTAREISCQFQLSGDTKVSLNICDDKKTFCKPLELSLKVQTQVADEKVLAPKNLKAVEAIRKILVPGFSVGSPEEMRKQAAEKKRPVFLMISTEWCPPCNEAKEFLFTSSTFASVSANWFKIYVDGDAMSAGAWEKTVPYAYFPTMVMLNSDFQEVGRFTKELRQKEFADWAAQQSQWLNIPIPKLKEKVKTLTETEGLRLLAWAIDADDKELLKTLRKKFAPTDDLQIRLALYDVTNIDKELGGVEKDSQQEKSLKVQKEKLLIELVVKTATKDDFADYLSMLCEANLEKCKSFEPKMKERFGIISKWSGLTESETASALAEEGLMQHEIYEAMGNAKAAKKVAEVCADKYELQVHLSKLKTARSANQGRVHCLEMSGQVDEAEALVTKLIQAYPNEPTFVVRMARLKKKQKKLDEAYAWIQKAEKLAYGYNWYSAILFKANLEVEMKNRQAALTTLSGALAQVNLPEEKDRRNHMLVERIRALQETVQSPQ